MSSKGIWRKYAYLKNRAAHVVNENVKSEVKGILNEEYDLERQKEIDIMRKELEEIRILLKTLKKKLRG